MKIKYDFLFFFYSVISAFILLVGMSLPVLYFYESKLWLLWLIPLSIICCTQKYCLNYFKSKGIFDQNFNNE